MIVVGEVQVVVFSDWLFVWVWEMRGRGSALISLNPPGVLSQSSALSCSPAPRSLPSLWYTSQGLELMLMILKVSRHLIDHHGNVCVAGSSYQHMQGTDKGYCEFWRHSAFWTQQINLHSDPLCHLWGTESWCGQSYLHFVMVLETPKSN